MRISLSSQFSYHSSNVNFKWWEVRQGLSPKILVYPIVQFNICQLSIFNSKVDTTATQFVTPMCWITPKLNSSKNCWSYNIVQITTLYRFRNKDWYRSKICWVAVISGAGILSNFNRLNVASRLSWTVICPSSRISSWKRNWQQLSLF